ncbi:MAG: hypothetical protein Q8L92_07540 [Rubrivivax sp.]|nr:hypothetical protein [Rubrivivax sp.]
MDQFIHRGNLVHYRKLIAESKLDPSHCENGHAMLLTLPAEETAKDETVVRLCVP